MEVTTAPSTLLAEYLSLPLACADEPLLGEVAAAIAAAIAAAALPIYTDKVVMADAALLAIYSHHVSRFVAPGYDGSCANLYARALRSEESRPLCELLRSWECLADIEAAASSIARSTDPTEPHAVAQARAAAEARLRYQRTVAELHVKQGDELAAPARAFLDALDLQRQLDAAKARRAEAKRIAAEQAEVERRAAQDAADQAQDAADVERELERLLESHGLPTNVRSGFYVDSQLERLKLLVRARRRLREARVESIRVHLASNFSGGTGLYGCTSLANGIGDASVEELRSIVEALDRAEGRAEARLS